MTPAQRHEAIHAANAAAILPVTTFAAVCETCDWVSEPSSSNLAALAKFDRHVKSAGHISRAWSVAHPPEGEDPEDVAFEADLLAAGFTLR